MVGRIIPTRVGTSEQVVTMDGETQDHPHACGDKTDRPLIRTSREGSSPRVWGQALQLLDRHGEVRIIPTRVGTSVKIGIRQHITKDHPHACGDKTSRALLSSVLDGSSPRVWGQAKDTLTDQVYSGIIPTRVGTRSALRMA